MADFEHMIELYRDAYRRHGDGAAAVLWPKGRQDLRFEALTRRIREDGFSILDYGCGLAHLRDYLAQRFARFDYTGVDVVPEFVAACRAKYPGSRFIEAGAAALPSESFDYVVLSGVFNIRYLPDPTRHQEMVFETLAALWRRVRRSLAVNFMTDRVDFRQEGAYHQDIPALLAFARERLSPRFVLDQAYMPYEYTLTLEADTEVLRPENVYRSADDATRAG